MKKHCLTVLALLTLSVTSFAKSTNVVEMKIAGHTILKDSDFASAEAIDSGHKDWVIKLKMKPESTKVFSAATHDNIGKKLDISVDGKLLNSPIIRDQIKGDTAILSNNFTKDTAVSLAQKINEAIK